MPDLCDVQDDWKDATNDERLEMLRDIVEEKMREDGFDPVNVERYVAADDAVAIWDANTNTIYVDEERTLGQNDFGEAVDTAYHEAIHAERDQVWGGSAPTGDRTVTRDVGVYDLESDELRFDQETETVLGDDHVEVYEAARTESRADLERCGEADDYGAARDLDEDGTDDDEDDVLEFDMEDLDGLDDEDSDGGGGGAQSTSGTGEGGEGDLLIEWGEAVITPAPGP
jgi:hypothetical protein